MKILKWLLLMCLAGACVPKEQPVLRAIEINSVETSPSGDPILKANAIFYNPNPNRMRLKRIDIDVFVDGKKAARVDQDLSALIKPKSDFTIPLEVQLNLKEVGLLDTILSLFGGKKYELQFTGTLRVSVRGFPVNVPVNYKSELKL